MSESRVPAFAVVGRVNKGKSSVVSTLIEDDSVRIDKRPGTTRQCSSYPFRADDGRVLCYVVDTPGFEDAPRALTWLRERETTAAERARVVAMFVEAFRGGREFADECALLEPVLAGAAVLYVVDASLPYRANYEAEMEILRWSGRPGMALINRVGGDDHVAEWKRALGQYFSVVRVFDAHRSGFEERISLLTAFREIDDGARDAIDEAIATLRQDWQRRRLRSARVIAELLAESLTHVDEHRLGEHDSVQQHRAEWESRFLEGLRRRELRARREIEVLYRHERLERSEDALARGDFDADLFADESQRVFGLDTWQLVRAGAVGGAAIGGTIDAATLGHSFMAGSIVGGFLGGAAAYWGGKRAAEIKVLGQPMGGRVAVVGPIRDPNFPWILLDRAVMHHRAIAQRAHAKREVLKLEGSGGKMGPSSSLDAGEQRRFVTSFARFQRRNAAGSSEAVDVLADEIALLLERAKND